MKLLTIADAAARLGISISTAKAWAAAGRFPGATKPGRDWLIPETALAQVKRPATAGRPRSENYKPRRRPERPPKQRA